STHAYSRVGHNRRSFSFSRIASRFHMSFLSPIRITRRYGQEIARVEVPLTVLSPTGQFLRSFQFDTGCGLTSVSEDVATALHLPKGGQPISVSSASGKNKGRLISV